MEYIDNNDFQQCAEGSDKSDRPTGLIVLCVLTFIGSGLSALGQFVVFGFHDMMLEVSHSMAATMGGAFGQMYEQSAKIIISTPAYVYLINAICYLTSLIGAAIMLCMKRIGFHIYVLSQVLLIVLPFVLTKMWGGWFPLFSTILFIGLYGIFYKKMR
jgi:hypothetical protein